jgi:argininosuccinate lyase
MGGDAVGVMYGGLDIAEAIRTGMLDTLTVDRDRMRAAADEGYTTATAVADALVRRGVPFRTAHHVVGGLVAHAEEEGIGLDELHDDTIAAALSASDEPTAMALAAEAGIGGDLRAAAGLDGALASCDVIGGTAPVRVSVALKAARKRLDRE